MISVYRSISPLYREQYCGSSNIFKPISTFVIRAKRGIISVRLKIYYCLWIVLEFIQKFMGFPNLLLKLFYYQTKNMPIWVCIRCVLYIYIVSCGFKYYFCVCVWLIPESSGISVFDIQLCFVWACFELGQILFSG